MEFLPLFQPESNLHSLHSQIPILIRLTNLTNRPVDVIWINYIGEYVKHGTLNHNNFVEIKTYETHPWIAIDVETTNRLLIDNKFVFMPRYLPWREFARRQLQNVTSGGMSPRIPPLPITITTPLLSLRYRTLLELRSHLRSVNDVDLLGLPKELADALKSLIKERERLPSIMHLYRR